MNRGPADRSILAGSVRFSTASDQPDLGSIGGSLSGLVAIVRYLLSLRRGLVLRKRRRNEIGIAEDRLSLPRGAAGARLDNLSSERADRGSDTSTPCASSARSRSCWFIRVPFHQKGNRARCKRNGAGRIVDSAAFTRGPPKWDGLRAKRAIASRRSARRKRGSQVGSR